MASYIELSDLRKAGSSDSAFLKVRIGVAATIKAQTLMVKVGPTSNEIQWAANTLANPSGIAEVLYNYLLAANNAATIAQILAADDATIQIHVDAAATALIEGGVV